MDNKPDTAFQRGRVYDLLSHAFGEPSDEFLEFVREGGLLGHIAESLSLHPCGAEIDVQPLRQAAQEVRSATFDELTLQYEKLASPMLKVLYECNYHPPLTSSVEMADVAGFYRAFGLDFPGDRPDLLSMELEFMRIIAMKEARALMSNDRGNAEICISAQRSFLAAHLGRWASIVSRMTEGILFYGELSKFFSNWIAAEVRYLSVETSAILYYHLKDRDEEISDHCMKEAAHEGI